MDKITIVLIDKILYNTNMNTTYKSNNNVVYSCKYHVVWCPKYRRKVLTNGVDVRLKELLTEYAANRSVDILEMEIMPDHVYMLLEVDPQFGIHKAVKSFKGYTSRILRQEFPCFKTKMPTLWTNSYFVSTVAPGAGAAGGLGYAFLQYFNAEARPGAELLLNEIGFDALILDADLGRYR